MTLPRERTEAVLRTREFLRRLSIPLSTPGVPTEVRGEAARLLRHFPDSGDLSLVHDACPHWFGKPAGRP